MVESTTSKMYFGSPKRRAGRIDAQLLSAPEQQEETFEGLLSRRGGSVLTRNTILKSDHFGTDHFTGVDLRLLGAPNFRQAQLNVFGVAQPTAPGLSTVLKLLRCSPEKDNLPGQSCTWFSTREEPLIYINGRPFVLRDRHSPFENIRSYAGIAASRLEQMEMRLKQDILDEVAKNNGLLLIHDEVIEHHVIPCLTAIETVKTSAEIFTDMKSAGFSVQYKRVPINNEQSPTDAFIDEFVKTFRAMPTTNHYIIFSCGIGIGRTTYAMVIGMILRRAIIIKETNEDPLGVISNYSLDSDKTTRTVLRLVSVLEQGLQGRDEKKSVIDWTLARGNLIDSLKDAILGNFQIIVDLVRALKHGQLCKQVVDEAIDRCISLKWSGWR